MIQITGLWWAKTKDGKDYLQGTIGNARILIFKNEKKNQEKQPDFNVCLGEKQQKETGNENMPYDPGKPPF